MGLGAFEDMGLSALGARVLGIVLRDEEVTATRLCAETGASAPAMGIAVESLLKQGLLDRTRGTRPLVIFIRDGAEEALAALRADDEAQRSARRAQADAALAAVAAAAARARDRKRPYAEQRRLLGPRRGRTSHQQVLTASDLLSWSVARSCLGCPAQLLVTDGEDVPELDDAALAVVVSRQQPGSEIRISGELLPRLWVLDGSHAGTASGTPLGHEVGWTWDGRHVRAAAELFETWWRRAPAGGVTPHPPALAEPEWEVDEWDPADLSG